MNLLRGTGRRGAAGMQRESRFRGKTLWRPLLDVPREALIAYAREHGLNWIEDESNANQSLTRNFVRQTVGPLLETKYPHGVRTSLGPPGISPARRPGRKSCCGNFYKRRDCAHRARRGWWRC